MITFGVPTIEEAEIREVVATLKSGWLGTGPRVARFEKNFKAYKGAAHAVAVNSCTSALHLSLLALRLKPGAEVITSALTFCATVNAIIHAGAKPVLADVDPRTMNMDPKSVAGKIGSRTRVILPVHFAGRPCEMDALMALARRHGLRVVEDCAHAIEASYKGRPAGTFGDSACFSFYATKNITTGEGGMVLTRQKRDAERINILALQGMSQDAWKRSHEEKAGTPFQIIEAGFKCRMSDIQAAIGLHQLKRVKAYWSRRREIWARYDDAFSNLPIELPAPPARDTEHAFHLYTILVDQKRSGLTREAFIKKLSTRGVGAGIHYLSIPEHRYYSRRFGWKPGEYPHARRIGRQTVSLPLSAGLGSKEVDQVIEAVTDCFS